MSTREDFQKLWWNRIRQSVKAGDIDNFTLPPDFGQDPSFPPEPESDSQEGMEEFFGALLICLGLVAAAANVLILIAVVKHLKYRNPLFLIITNFAIIDLFKALSAIYVGVVLVQVVQMSPWQRDTNMGLYAVMIKMLQTSLLLMHLGNLCSVFNLILATANEFLYIKVPFWYRKMMTRKRVIMAILVTWAMALGFTLAKGLHGQGGVGRNMVLVSKDSNATNMQFLRHNHTSKDIATEIYSLVLLQCLLLCLFVVSIVYANLYMTIRRADRFRTTFRQKRNDSQKRTTENNVTPSPTKQEREAENLISSDTVSARPSPRPRKQRPTLSSKSSLARTASQPRLFRRYKCVLVILIVCAVHFVYLSIFFALQLLHFINMQADLEMDTLKKRYFLNFSLRAIFVLHASLNPLIFFRIRSFRVAFCKAFRMSCCLGESRLSRSFSLLRKYTIPSKLPPAPKPSVQPARKAYQTVERENCVCDSENRLTLPKADNVINVLGEQQVTVV